jgi:hypothetical protein
MSTERKEVPLLILAVKLFLIFSLAEFFENVFYSHAKFGFVAGAVLGTIVQEFIPPKSGRKQLVLLIVLTLVWSVIRSFVH